MRRLVKQRRSLRAWFFVAWGVVIGLGVWGCAGQASVSRDEARSSSFERMEIGGGGAELVAVGSGPTLDEAIDAAMARLAQSIRAHVSSEETAVTQAERLESGGRRGSDMRTSFDRVVRVSSDERLIGARVVETGRDRETGMHYARVSLDRIAAASQMDRDAAHEARTAQLSLIAALSSRSAWRRFQLLGEASRAVDAAGRHLEARDALIGGSSWGSLERSSLLELDAEIMHELARARETIRIGVVASNGRGERVAALARRTLAEMGVQRVSASPAILIRCDMLVEPARSFDPDLSAARWCVRIEVVDPIELVTIDALQLEGVATSRHSAQRVAEREAMERASEAIEAFLRKALGAM